MEQNWQADGVMSNVVVRALTAVAHVGTNDAAILALKG